MPAIAAMVSGPELQELTRQQIGAMATVRFCETGESLVDLVARGGIDAVVADFWDVAGASVMPILATLHRRTPHLPLVLYCLPTPEVLREIPDIMSVTPGLNVVLRNHEHLGSALRPMLFPFRAPSAGETLVRHIVPLVPGPFRSFVLVTALKASPGLRVGTAATWSGVPRRTLERSLQMAGLPSASMILGSCTALHAAWWLDVHGWSAKQVVTAMHFSHESSVVRILQRHFGFTMTSFRKAGGFQELLRRFESTILGGRPTQLRI